MSYIHGALSLPQTIVYLKKQGPTIEWIVNYVTY